MSTVPPLPHTHDDYPDRPCPACEAEEHQRHASPAQSDSMRRADTANGEGDPE